MLGRALWNADQVRDFHMSQVGEELGFERGILIADETGFLKKGKNQLELHVSIVEQQDSNSILRQASYDHIFL